MKLPSPKRVAAILMLLLLMTLVPIGIAMEWSGKSEPALPQWELKWGQSKADSLNEAAAAPDQDWMKVSASAARPLPPTGVNAAWLRFALPEATTNSALLIDKVYGNTIKAYRNNEIIYDSSQMVNNNLIAFYVKQDLVDMVLGAALIFMAVVLMTCLFFVRVDLFSGGLWLVLVIFSFGVLFITYSPFLPLILRNQGRLIETFFDLALFTLLPAFTFYFERVFGPGRGKRLVRFRNFQLGYSIFCFGFLLLNTLLSFRLDHLYRIMTVEVMGILMIIQLAYLLGLAVIYAYRGNRDAVIFSFGFAIFAVVSLGELLLYFTSAERYHLYWWKWGVIAFVISLIVILGRGFARNYKQAVSYSRDLEKFNNEVQRSEKMEIISELAASVAHEVRNPLQVTRGFLQILGERSGKKEKEYLDMAMQELDRASVIITDFLTFAKPGLDQEDVLEVSAELKHVSGILVPLANLQGGAIQLQLQDGLHVLGSSPKFKQAFINLIKNSVESLQENGLIKVSAWKSGAHIVVSVKDNGEGMKVSELARLGEPYYSNKTKGTGLGLMVTFRIVEAMNGSIQFHSKKGEGTEVIVKLPAYRNK